MKFNTEKIFKNHTATLKDLGEIKILDFKNGDLFESRLRFLFDEKYCRLHISGDYGELTALNYNNMRYQYFEKYFCNNTGYFVEKIECMSRDKFIYDKEIARKELIENLFGENTTYGQLNEGQKEDVDEIMGYFDEDYGFENTEVYNNVPQCLMDRSDDYYYWLGDCGKEYNPVIELYLNAFNLAKSRLKES